MSYAVTTFLAVCLGVLFIVAVYWSMEQRVARLQLQVDALRGFVSAAHQRVAELEMRFGDEERHTDLRDEEPGMTPAPQARRPLDLEAMWGKPVPRSQPAMRPTSFERVLKDDDE